jgi:hypothetical protein
VLQGLAPFGKPMNPVGIAESTTAALRGDDLPEDSSTSANGPDSCMFTTGHPVL